MKPLAECRILVTPTSYGQYDDTLKINLEAKVEEVIYNETGKPLSSEQLAEMLVDVDGYIAGLDFIDERALEAANQLKIIARYGVGVDRVDLQAAASKGIIVTNTPGANSRSVAELTIGLMLSLARQIPYANKSVRAGDWPRLRGISINGKIVGIVGFGAIGKLVTEMLKPFLCKVLVYDPMVDNRVIQSFGATPVDLATIQKQADFLSVHVPLVSETTNMIDKTFMAGMKKGASIINTSRGGIVNENDLYEMMADGHIYSAALDAYENEPPQNQLPLFTIPQAIFTPHTGAHTDDATNSMGTMALDECLRVLQGEAPRFRVN